MGHESEFPAACQRRRHKTEFHKWTHTYGKQVVVNVSDLSEIDLPDLVFAWYGSKHTAVAHALDRQHVVVKHTVAADPLDPQLVVCQFDMLQNVRTVQKICVAVSHAFLP